ncbi:MAG: S26 family signal peptidase [Sphingomonas sp.]|jgi:conjugative transfer signal peptidase TraF|uniref:S26 family signal peptidase n=1 Tax=Sphingomonas sp. TaxID=28214 RepID=UPI0035623129
MTRFGYVMTAYFASLGTVIAAFVTPAPRLIWNASASVPEGLYRVRPSAPIRRGDLVALRPAAPLALYMAQRHYLPLGVPMLKHVVGLPRDRVCRMGLRITVNGKAVGRALRHDRLGRPLPRWQGCHSLSAGQLFVMNSDVRDSFDGRYFGPIDRFRVIGRATPLWLTGAQETGPRDIDERVARVASGAGS